MAKSEDHRCQKSAYQITKYELEVNKREMASTEQFIKKKWFPSIKRSIRDIHKNAQPNTIQTIFPEFCMQHNIIFVAAMNLK